MNNKELERKQKEITDLQNTITDLNSRLKESESLKSNFISNIMNEVYNPFSSILGMADNIISLGKDNIENAIPMAEIIYREAAQLDFHLQNIFTAARIEAGLEDIENSSINILDIHKSLLKDFLFDIKNKQLTVSSNIEEVSPIVVISDSKKLKLILLNLLSNSIKNSSDEAQIDINYELIEDHLNISITDHGIGITDSEMEVVFDRFKRIDTTINSVTGGTGLGLSVVKALTELLNGNIKMHNDNGTKVVICVPNQDIIDSNFEDDGILFDEEIF